MIIDNHRDAEETPIKEVVVERENTLISNAYESEINDTKKWIKTDFDQT